MIPDRSRVRALVRRELEKRLGAPARGRYFHAALLEIYQGPPCDEDSLDGSGPGPCIIEPDKPCKQSGYCKKLGY